MAARKSKKASGKGATARASGEEPEADADGAEGAEADGDEAAEPDGPAEDDLAAETIDERALEQVGARRAARGGSTALTRSDPLEQYMREIQRHRLLSAEESHDLAVRYATTGDVKAAATLVTANLRLVVKLAYEYRRAARNIMDLIQEGNIGLMQAVKRYDPYRGVKLSSYSAWWIRAYMLRFILNNWRLVKLGTTQAQRRLFFNLNKEKARLAAMGIEPTPLAIAERLRVDEQEVIDMDRRLARSDASLDAPVGDPDGKQTTRMDLLPASSMGPEAATQSAELSELVRERLDEFRQTLSGKDLQIFDERVVAEEPLTLQELGDRFGVSRERVRQLEARLTGKLRDFLRASLGDAVDVSG